MEKQRMLSAEETAKILGISRASLSRLVLANQIGHYRIGHRTMFDEDNLKTFREATFQPPAKNPRQAHNRNARRSDKRRFEGEQL